MCDDGFRVHLTPAAERDLVSLRSNRHAVENALLALSETPLAGRTLRGSLHGVRSLHSAVNGTAFRAAYTIDAEQRTCLVFIVGPGRGFYSKAIRRARARGGARRKRC